MPLTKTQIGLLALQALKVIEGNNTTPEPDDTTVINQAYDNVYAKLLSKGLVTWSLADNIPDLYIDPVMWLVAESRITVFDPDIETKSFIVAKASNSVQEIIEANALNYVSSITPSESF